MGREREKCKKKGWRDRERKREMGHERDREIE